MRPAHALSFFERQLCADSVEKVLLDVGLKILKAARAFHALRCEGPYRFIQNRPQTSVAALKSDAAAEKSKHQLSRDFSGRSIFDVFNTIRQKQPLANLTLCN
jgi:hypothetical protein